MLESFVLREEDSVRVQQEDLRDCHNGSLRQDGRPI